VNRAGARSAWLDSYVAAWLSYAADDIRALFTEDIAYRYHPGDNPIVGREAVVASWLIVQGYRVRQIRRGITPSHAGGSAGSKRVPVELLAERLTQSRFTVMPSPGARAAPAPLRRHPPDTNRSDGAFQGQ
jgi:hypothetical protein